jgi:hypothetical protein
MSAAVLWFRRDLRLGDHPALAAAAQEGLVVALFVLDDALRRPSGAPRIAFLYRTLRALDEQLREHGGALTVRHGRPENIVPAVARECGAASVHISADFGPYGAARDQRVEEALGGTPLVRTGSPYAVAPGQVAKGDGSPGQGRRVAVQGVHGVLPGLGGARLAGARRIPPGGDHLAQPGRHHDPAGPAPARWPDAAGGRRARGAGRLAPVPARAPCGLSEGAGPARSRPHLAVVAVPEVRLHPPANDPR